MMQGCANGLQRLHATASRDDLHLSSASVGAKSCNGVMEDKLSFETNALFSDVK